MRASSSWGLSQLLDEFLAEVPARQRGGLRFGRVPALVESGAEIERAPALHGDMRSETISASIQEITHRDAVLLQSADAIAFLANARELSEIATLPSIKMIDSIGVTSRFESQAYAISRPVL